MQRCTDLEQAEELKRSLCRVMVAVAQDIPYSSTLEKITAVSPEIPHIAEVANHPNTITVRKNLANLRDRLPPPQ
ncbi:hypothetical protein [Nostoc favosum]|uniref:Uncharacterized protein n=1 Tax=Nostoc favosum CHAB5714 TaxID=2780399 RepID=A0ABS8I565_9NOSO|nr:hypothetical protein [Nostoc favosum]MCC5599192.1 hypothetical protein [Nostoc favosum CHAB5714]